MHPYLSYYLKWLASLLLYSGTKIYYLSGICITKTVGHIIKVCFHQVSKLLSLTQGDSDRTLTFKSEATFIIACDINFGYNIYSSHNITQ